MPVTDYTPESMVERAVRNAKPHEAGDAPDGNLKTADVQMQEAS